MIYIANKKTKEDNILKKFPNSIIIDVTSKGQQPWVKFSPFYPHGCIPIPPYNNNNIKYYSETVEGIWQGLKVFESEDIDCSKFGIRNMEGIKRSARKFGKPLGHRNGVESNELLDYATARTAIYLKAYAWVLENLLQKEVQLLKDKASKQDLILLDYNTNEDINNYNKPLSHAGLVKKYLIKKFPELGTLTFNFSNQKKSQKTRRKSKDKIENTKNAVPIQKTIFDIS